MEEIRSRYNPLLSLDYILNADENKIFDRKSARVKGADIAPLISAFANADGGTIVIGVDEKSRIIEGVNSQGVERINALILAPRDCCKPMPVYREEYLDVINSEGNNDKLLLLHIDPCPVVIRTSNDSTFLRMADKTKELKGDDLRNLEYAKGVRQYEDELNYEAKMEDLDIDLIKRYQEILHAENDPVEQILSARGFLKSSKDKKYLTNAAVLLFAKDIQRFYPNCRIRFIRYEGTYAGTGVDINIIKDVSIECAILEIIDKAKSFISSQLRDFVALNSKTGQFITVPEYPEFAWLEGIVNAVTHREYAMAGSHICVSMYDDRLEILSPGRLPSIVTIDNIRETRYSRNPRIARVLTEFGWVKELNEGVKRIYSDMQKLFLEEPIYSEPEHSVRLVLKNNIVMRNIRRTGRLLENIGVGEWNTLDDLDRQMLVFMSNRAATNRAMLEQYTGRSSRTINLRLNRLLKRNLIKPTGNSHDPKRTYSIVYKES